MTQPDICVVGGGPAGLAAAIALRLTGASVLVLDANTPPIDKACGEGLLPDTLHALRQLGAFIPAGEGVAFRGIRFVHAELAAQADFPNGHAIGLRRTALHRVLVERARELAVELRWNAKGIRIGAHDLFADGGVFKPKLIVGADGQKSAVRAAAGLSAARYFEQRYGFRRHYRVAPWTPYVEVHWGKRCQVYVTPISPNEVGVALLTSDPRQRLEHALPLFPALWARLENARAVTAEMGAITASRRLKHVYRNRVALIGDASGSVDAITGEGLGLAVRQAIALGQAFRSGQMEEYESAHGRIRRRVASMARLMLVLSRYKILQHSVIAGLAKFPEFFERMLAFHIGDCTSEAGIVTGAGSSSRPNPERLNSQS